MVNQPNIFVLLPAFNEENGLQEFLVSITNILDDYNRPYQIVVCNDGSKDGTGAILENCARKNRRIIILVHKVNSGLGEAIQTLFQYAANIATPLDYLIRMDCDATHDPSYIPKIIDELENGVDVVIASRFKKGGGQIGVPLSRSVLSRVANLFLRASFPNRNKINEYTSGYRGYKASIIKKAFDVYGNNFIQLRNLGFTCTVEKLIKLNLIGAKIVEIPFVLRYDKKVNASKMITNITTFGYLIMALLYHWPKTGWKRVFKKTD